MLDGVMLAQILVNLMHNAARFTARGHLCLRCTVEPEVAGRRLVSFAVQDTGSEGATGTERGAVAITRATLKLTKANNGAAGRRSRARRSHRRAPVVDYLVQEFYADNYGLGHRMRTLAVLQDAARAAQA